MARGDVPAAALTDSLTHWGWCGVRIECTQKHLDSKKHVEDMMALDDTRTKLQEKKAKLAIQKGKWVEAGLEQFGLEAALAVSAPLPARLPVSCPFHSF